MMNIQNMFAQVRAAQNLANAIDRGHMPEKKDLSALGMPSSLRSKFKR